MNNEPMHELHKRAAYAKLDRVERQVSIAIEALNFMIQHYDEDLQFYHFLHGVLIEVHGRVEGVRNGINKLADLADPKCPEDLPF